MNQRTFARCLALAVAVVTGACTTTTRRIRVDSSVEATIEAKYLEGDRTAPPPQVAPAEFEIRHRARGTAVIGLVLGSIVMAAGAQLYIASLDGPDDPSQTDNNGAEEAAGITMLSVGGATLLASIVGLAVPVKKTQVRFSATQPGYSPAQQTLTFPGSTSELLFALEPVPVPAPTRTTVTATTSTGTSTSTATEHGN